MNLYDLPAGVPAGSVQQYKALLKPNVADTGQIFTQSSSHPQQLQACKEACICCNRLLFSRGGSRPADPPMIRYQPSVTKSVCAPRAGGGAGAGAGAGAGDLESLAKLRLIEATPATTCRHADKSDRIRYTKLRSTSSNTQTSDWADWHRFVSLSLCTSG